MKVIKKAPYQLCCFFGVMALSITLILSLFNKVVVTNDTSEYVNYYIFKFNYVVCAAVVFCIVKYSKKITDKISVTLLLIICTLIYIVFGIYFIVNVEPVLKADAQIVYNIAQAFIVKDYSAMNIGQYLYTCPHQLGLVVYESILLRIWNSPYAIFAANLLHVLVINFFTVKISALIFESNKTIVKYTIIGVFAFFPQLFFVVFAYGQIPGLSFSTIAVYFTIKYLKYGKGKNLLAATIGSAFAVVVRNNYIILVLALCAVCVLKLLKKVDIRTAVILICLLFAIFMPSKILLGFYEAKSGIDIQGEPKLLYVAMGLQEGNRAPGWYTGFNYTYSQVDYNYDLAEEIAKEEILSRVNYFVKNPKYFVWFFYKKFVSTWCDSTFQSIWSGPIDTDVSYTNTAFLKSMYSYGTIFEIFVSICNVVVVSVLFFSLIHSIFKLNNKRKEKTYELLPIIFMIGGMMFHLIWETKSQYVYMYIFMLIPLAANGLYKIQEYISK